MSTRLKCCPSCSFLQPLATLMKRRLVGKQRPPASYGPVVKKQRVGLASEELLQMVRITMAQSDALLGRARAFSYMLLCSNMDYDMDLLAQLPTPVLREVLNILIHGRPKSLIQGFHPQDGRQPAKTPVNMAVKTLQGYRAYQVKHMLRDFKVETAWTFSYPQAVEWHRTLGAMKKSVEDRFVQRRKNSDPEILPPIALREVADAFVNSPSLELTFVSLMSCNKRRISTAYTSNYRLALEQHQGLADLLARCKDWKQKELDKALDNFKKDAAAAVEYEKTRLVQRERELIASVSGALQKANSKVGNELQKLIGLDQLSMSAEEVASHLEEAPQAVVTRLRTFVFSFLSGAQRLKATAVKVVVDKKKQQDGAVITSPLFTDQGSAVLPQVLPFLSLRQVMYCRGVSINCFEASNVNLRLRLSRFVYADDFLHGRRTSRAGRMLNVNVPTQVRHLNGLLSTPSCSKFFEELDLRAAPRECLRAISIAPCLARMVSLRSLSLPFLGKEWARSELSRIHKALPQGASCQSYADDGSLSIEHVQGEKRYALKGKSLP